MEYIEIQQVQVPVVGEFRAPAFLVTVAVEQLAKRLKKPTDPFEAVLPSLFQFQNVPWFFETKAGTIELLNPATFDLPSGRWRPEQCIVGILFRQKDLRNPDLELLLRFAADELEVARLHLRPAASSSRAGKKVPKRQPWHPAVDRVDSDPLLRRLISRFLPGHHRVSAESLSASALRALGIPAGERIIQVYRERKAPANAGSVVPAAMPGKPGAPNRTTTLPSPGASGGGKAMAEGGAHAEEDAALPGAEVASAGRSAGPQRAPLDRRAGEGNPSHVRQKEAAASAATDEGGLGQGKWTEAPSDDDYHLAATSPAPGAE